MEDEFVDATTALVGQRGDKNFFVGLVRNEKRIYKHRL